MPNLANVLKDEISRLARKEIRSATSTVRKQAAQYRRDIADLKRQIADLNREVRFLRMQEKRRIVEEPDKGDGENVRFSPGWVKKHREKLGLSADKYAKLVGVSGLTIYNWEQGKSRPQAKQRAAWGEIRHLRKREAMKRLEMLGE
jgi:DNA-binding transcriptional regulator YiaG